MRFIKMSPDDEDTQTIDDVVRFFDDTLQKRSPIGRFSFKKGKISKVGLTRGECLVFVYQTRVVYLAKSSSGRLQAEPDAALPYYFAIDVKSLKSYDVSVHLVQMELDKYEYKKSINGQGWNIVHLKNVPANEEYPVMDKILKRLCDD